MSKRSVVGVLSFALVLTGVAGVKPCGEIVLVEPKDKASVGLLPGTCPARAKLAWRCRHPKEASCSGVYAVEVMKRRDGRIHFAAESLATNEVELVNLEAGEEYTWSVWCGEKVNGARFFTKGDAPHLPDREGVPPTDLRGLPRWQSAEGVGNLRDLGGWPTADGAVVRTGLVYRAASLDRVTEKGRARLVGDLGVVTDLDLRRAKEIQKLGGKSPLGVGFENQSAMSYGDFATERGRASFAHTFRWLVHKAKYPLVFHCEKGADRTGSLAFFLNGLLGVSEADLRYDWEVTSRANANPLFKHRGRYDELRKVVAACPGEDWTAKCVAYAHLCGITDAEIAKWRGMMLEKAK